jgi:hypothetical protein
MRNTLFVLSLAIGLGLGLTSGAGAVPIDATAMREAAAATSPPNTGRGAAESSNVFASSSSALTSATGIRSDADKLNATVRLAKPAAEKTRGGLCQVIVFLAY